MQINNATLSFAWALRQVGKRIRLRGWERLLRTLFHPDKQRPVAFKIPFNGFTYPAYADKIVDWNALFYGTYETFELTLLAAMADSIEGAVFVDAGANVGHHALYMAAHARRVHAFEPNPALWPLIEEKVSINNLDNLTLHRCGLGSKACQLPLYLGPESGEASLLAGASRTSLSTSVSVTIVQGDDYFQQAGIDRVDLVKMDIEGFEKHAIEGLGTYLDTWRPLMMIELSETGREQFGDFTAFVKAFPGDYGLYFCHLTSGLLIHTVMRAADEMAYDGFVGNVFCIPKERQYLFQALAGDAIAPVNFGSASHDHY